MKAGFKKICVSVSSESELFDIYDKAKELNIPCALIRDAGLTEFNGVPTSYFIYKLCVQ
jgi:PTH2 family peptidyl-tRNA hydrolase